MKNGTMRYSVSLGVMAVLVTVSGQLNAQRVRQFVPFQEFMESTRSADSLEHMTRPGSQVKAAAALEEMRQHILSMYRDVEVKHSFVRDDSHFDCVPVEQQPALRLLGIESIAEEPPQSLLAGHVTPVDPTGEVLASAATQIDSTPADEFGNSSGCDTGTIPIRRITLDEMTQFPTLRDFFSKGPKATGPAVNGAAHKYAFMQQNVNNLGGSSTLSLWNPYVNTALGEVFSLSQEWYVGGSGSSVQTAEVGWQNFPAHFGGSQGSRLFIYWTADNYNKTGCYNMECGAFVQKSNTSTFGATFANYSTPGGPQYELSAEFYLYQGNWWLSINGTWVGYYPASIYKGGQMTKNAQVIQFGTESVGTTVWPGEGSGYWATSGRNYAAYQRNLFYINTSGATVFDTLTPHTPSPKCYNTSGPFSSTSTGWSVYFYEGGPGGSGC